MVKKITRCLILILSALALMLSFQNCKQVQNEESAGVDCSSTFSVECLLQKSDITSYSLSLVNTNLIFGGMKNYYNYEYQVSLQDDQLSFINSNSKDQCSLTQNSKWQQAKELYLKNGICRFNVDTSEDKVVCMAMAIPYAQVIDANQNQIHLSYSLCQNQFDSLCSYEDAVQFKALLDELSDQIQTDQACD